LQQRQKSKFFEGHDFSHAKGKKTDETSLEYLRANRLIRDRKAANLP